MDQVLLALVIFAVPVGWLIVWVLNGISNESWEWRRGEKRSFVSGIDWRSRITRLSLAVVGIIIFFAWVQPWLEEQRARAEARREAEQTWLRSAPDDDYFSSDAEYVPSDPSYLSDEYVDQYEPELDFEVFVHGWADGCHEAFGPSPDGDAYWHGDRYSIDDCVDDLDSYMGDGEGGYSAGYDAGYEYAFDMTPEGVLCWGEECWSA